MKKALFTSLFLLALGSASAQSNIESTIRFTNDSSETGVLVYGVHSMATDTIDTQLGEKTLPNFFPPTGMAAYFSVTDKIGEIYTPKDLRKSAPGRYMRQYLIRIPTYSARGPYTITWDALPAMIDSARIVDNFSGDVINISMKDSNSARIQNAIPGIGKDVIETFYLRVWYNDNNISGVEEEAIAYDAAVFPNPAKNDFTIDLDGNYSYSLHTMLGTTVAEGENQQGASHVDMQMLPEGVYILQLRTEAGRTETRKIIKQ